MPRGTEPGDWVVPARDGLGTMRSLAVWEEKDYLVVPKEIMPLEYMALHRELALAYHLMESSAKQLKPGDALIINAANGAVGQTLVQLCRLMNIRAIAVIRRHDNFADTKAWLEFLGAYKVFADDEAIAPALKAEYASLPTLGFDGVGGVATLKLMRALAPGSRIVSYGFIGARTISIPWQVIVNSRVTIEGADILRRCHRGQQSLHVSCLRACRTQLALQLIEHLLIEHLHDVFRVDIDADSIICTSVACGPALANDLEPLGRLHLAECELG